MDLKIDIRRNTKTSDFSCRKPFVIIMIRIAINVKCKQSLNNCFTVHKMIPSKYLRVSVEQNQLLKHIDKRVLSHN
jgi:hypothetical protein